MTEFDAQAYRQAEQSDQVREEVVWDNLEDIEKEASSGSVTFLDNCRGKSNDPLKFTRNSVSYPSGSDGRREKCTVPLLPGDVKKISMQGNGSHIVVTFSNAQGSSFEVGLHAVKAHPRDDYFYAAFNEERAKNAKNGIKPQNVK